MSKEIIFKQSCLIRRNTPELRDKLSDLGYKIHKLSETEDWEYGILCNGKVAVGIPDNCREFNLDEYLKNNPQIIDCGKNEDLFLAIAALRNDTDKNQWFTDSSDDFWYISGDDNSDSTIKYYKERYNRKIHKATIEELINHFKKE